MIKDDIEKMRAMKWYHKIELDKGVITPGYDFDEIWLPLKKEMKEVDFDNKKVLDIGCWDGLWSFEAEKMGAAEVFATDIHNQRSFSEQGSITRNPLDHRVGFGQSGFRSARMAGGFPSPFGDRIHCHPLSQITRPLQKTAG